MQLLDIRFSFICRSTYANDEGRNPIVLRVVFRKERRDVFTGLYCFKSDWDGDSQAVLRTDKSFRMINQNLQLILQRANGTFDQLRFSGVPFTIDELINKMKGTEDGPELLIDFLQQGIDKLKKRVGVDISKATWFKYRRSLQHVIDFLQAEYNVKNYPLSKIDAKFLEKYYYFMRTDKQISHNSVLKYFQSFRSILSPAVKSGIIKHDPFAEVKFKPKPVYKEVLTQEELDRLTSVPLAGKDLNRIRDIFLFACYTGLAYTDIKQLNSQHIIMDADSTLYIRKPRQKTGQESIIPLLPPAVRILKKYSLTGNIRDLGWYVSSNQKMNKRLKNIGEYSGISKELHMHMARHTFATTVTLSNGVPLETVSSMLGHASLRQTQHYAKIVASKVKRDMEKLNGLYL
jgi:site-specific recombinase XerD